ncbi:U3 small nucleolar ribonucleoprotein complex-associated protein, putative [Eimeria brunetti]|uniref:U3 small nucleolar ribonucleoprotein complex-associated protein, putative n=1 Tax=Eimeria brunetti TaxID=51314 RepID=U6LSN4_9EIME|nr:U3 small nucleolar ribonucleoprotein complex-associated protein, putative [Eimeria brunetti]
MADSRGKGASRFSRLRSSGLTGRRGLAKSSRGGEEKAFNAASANKRRRIEDENVDSDSASGAETPPETDSESDGADGTTDEARLRIAQDYLRQVSATAKGRRPKKDSADLVSSASEATGAAAAADPAFESSGDSDGDKYDEESDNDDLFEYDGEAKEALAAELKKKAGRVKLSSRQVSSVAASLRLKDAGFFRGHKLPVTCVALPGEGSCDPSSSGGGARGCAYTGGKDCCVIRWDLEAGKKEIFKGQRNCFMAGADNGNSKQANCRGHFRAVLSVCVTEDERLFFSGGADQTIKAWDPRASNEKCVFELRGHRGAVTGLCLNGGKLGDADAESELLSCSADKSIRSWSVSCRSFSNCFYGHASEVNCIDILQANKPITGGNDGSLRNWKLVQDTHTAFPPLGSCVDSISLLSPTLFACGTQGGLLAVFNSSYKRPLSCVRVSQHTAAAAASKAEDTSGDAYTLQALQRAPAPLRATAAASAVSALCAFPFTDALLVGTEEGTVQLWEATQTAKKGGGSLRAMPGAGIGAGGAVNGISLSRDHSFAVAAVSTESRLGRWFKYEGGKNGIRIVQIQKE